MKLVSQLKFSLAQNFVMKLVEVQAQFKLHIHNHRKNRQECYVYAAPVAFVKKYTQLLLLNLTFLYSSLLSENCVYEKRYILKKLLKRIRVAIYKTWNNQSLYSRYLVNRKLCFVPTSGGYCFDVGKTWIVLEIKRAFHVFSASVLILLFVIRLNFCCC